MRRDLTYHEARPAPAWENAVTVAELNRLWKVSLEGLAAKLELVPDDHPLLDQPVWSGQFQGPQGLLDEAALTPRQLMVHLAVISYEVPRAFAEGTGFEPVKAASAELAGAAPSALATALRERIPKTLGMMEALGDARLAETVETPLMTAPLGEILMLTLFHVVHHKGQLMMELRRMGIRPGRFI